MKKDSYYEKELRTINCILVCCFVYGFCTTAHSASQVSQSLLGHLVL